LQNDKGSGMSIDKTKKTIGPWVRLSSEQIYENPWLCLTHEKVITPAGTDGIYGKVHFKNYGIGVIPLFDNNDTVLVGQYRYALDEYSWEIPMGGGPLDQDSLASAKRELEEETGLVAKEWECLLKLHTSNSITDEQGFVFLARGLEQGQQSLEDSESDIVVRRLPLKEAVAMALSGEITDAISIAGLLAVERQLVGPS